MKPALLGVLAVLLLWLALASAMGCGPVYRPVFLPSCPDGVAQEFIDAGPGQPGYGWCPDISDENHRSDFARRRMDAGVPDGR